jgi:hypothetical protein
MGIVSPGFSRHQALPAGDVTVGLHCVTKWPKLGTLRHGVSLDTVMAGVMTAAQYAVARAVGDYTA